MNVSLNFTLYYLARTLAFVALTRNYNFATCFADIQAMNATLRRQIAQMNEEINNLRNDDNKTRTGKQKTFYSKKNSKRLSFALVLRKILKHVQV